MTKPSYLALYSTNQLAPKVNQAREILKDCTLCPHHCHVDRTEGELGYCKTDEKIRIASYGAHFGEEPPLVGHKIPELYFLAIVIYAVSTVKITPR